MHGETNQFMNPPKEPKISKEEAEAVMKFRTILKNGHSAEIKRRRDGGLTVYEVRKEKK